MKIALKNSLSSLQDIFRKAMPPRTASGSTISTSLDIGDTYVKAISIKRNNHDVAVIGFACEKTSSDVKSTIKYILSNMPVNKREIALSIAGRGVVLRYVNLPIMNHEDTASAMAFELEKYIPFSKDEVHFDFSVLKKNKNTGKMLVLIAAAKKDIIAEKIKLCEELGYRLRFIDVNPLAIANYCAEIEGVKEGVCAALDLGSAVASVDILEDGLLVLSRDIFIGGNDFTKKISEYFNKDFQEAEQIKMTALDSAVASSLESAMSNLIAELKVSFDFYETQTNRLIDKILLTGGTAKLGGIVDALHQSLGQEVELIQYNPQKLTVDPSVDMQRLKEHFNYLIVALGTALR